MKKIGLRELRKMGACSDARRTFRREFPRGAEFNKETALRVVHTMKRSHICWFLGRAISHRTSEAYLHMHWRVFDLHELDYEQCLHREAQWLYRAMVRHADKIDAYFKEVMIR